MVAAHSDGRFPSDESLDHLRSGLGAFVRSAGAAPDEAAVCDALARLAQEARESRLHGEHLLVEFKRVWQEMPEVRALRDARERPRLLDRLVTLCIDAYYRRG